MDSYSISDLKQIFARYDRNGDGKLSPSELRLFMWSVGEELIPEDAEYVIQCSDLNGDGLLDFDEFIRLVVGKSGNGKEDEEDDRELKEAFEMFKMEGEGAGITATSLKRMLGLLGTLKSIEECKGVICRFDANGDGVISFDEFKEMMMMG